MSETTPGSLHRPSYPLGLQGLLSENFARRLLRRRAGKQVGTVARLRRGITETVRSHRTQRTATQRNATQQIGPYDVPSKCKAKLYYRRRAIVTSDTTNG